MKDLGHLRYCPDWLVVRTSGTIQDMVSCRGIAVDGGPDWDGSNPEHGAWSSSFEVGRGRRIPGVLAREKQRIRPGAWSEGYRRRHD